jgi:hypothetical protein
VDGIPVAARFSPTVQIGAGVNPASYTMGRGEFRSRQTRQLPRAVDLKGRFLFLVVVKC